MEVDRRMLRRALHFSVISACGLALGTAFEYGYVVSASRLLDTNAFGIFSTVLAVLTVTLGIGSAGLGQTLARQLATVSGCRESAEKWISTTIVMQLGVGISAGILLAGLSFVSAQDPKLQDIAQPLILVAWMMPILILAAHIPYIDLGYSNVTGFNLLLVLNPAARLGLVVLFAALLPKLTLESIFLAFGAGSLAVILVRISELKDFFSWAAVRSSTAVAGLRFAVPVALISGMTILFLRADVIFLKLWLPYDPNPAIARYTVPAIIARLVFYVATIASTALLPLVASADRFPSKAVIAGLVSLVICFSLLVGLAGVAGVDAARILFPESLHGSVDLLVPLASAMSLIGVGYVVGTVLLAAGRPRPSALAFSLGFCVYALGSFVTLRGGAWPIIGSKASYGVTGVVWACIIGAGVAVLAQLPELCRLIRKERRRRA